MAEQTKETANGQISSRKRSELLSIVNRVIKQRNSAAKKQRAQVFREAEESGKNYLREYKASKKAELEKAAEKIKANPYYAEITGKSFAAMMYRMKTKLRQQKEIRKEKKELKRQYNREKKKLSIESRHISNYEKGQAKMEKARAKVERYVALQKAGLFHEEKDRVAMVRVGIRHDKICSLMMNERQEMWRDMSQRRIDAPDEQYRNNRDKCMSMFDDINFISSTEMEGGIYMGPNADAVETYHPITAEEHRKPIDFKEKNIEISPSSPVKTGTPDPQKQMQKQKETEEPHHGERS